MIALILDSNCPYQVFLVLFAAANLLGILFGYALAKARIKRLKEKLYFARFGL